MKDNLKRFFYRFRKQDGENKNTTNGKKLSVSKDLDKKLVLSLQKSRVPNWRQIKHLSKFLSDAEKKILQIASLVLLIAIVVIGWHTYNQYTEKIPQFGGEYTEALVGAPRFINPILAQTNDVDRDLSRLIFSSLLKYNATQNLTADLAEKYEISEDQKSYTIYLKNNVLWHDGKKFTADDVIFTVKSIQDPEYKSPLYNSLLGVQIEKIDDYTVVFRLEEPFTPFLEILTFGILPKHIWEDIPAANANLAEFNIKPIGSGPFKFDSLSKDKLGNIKSINLVSNEAYYQGRPFIKNINFKFYPDFTSAVEALRNRNVEGVSFLPKELKKSLERDDNLNYYSLQIPQYTAIFFNQIKNETLKKAKVRQALAMATPKQELLDQVLHSEGIIIDGPILPGSIGYNPDIKKYLFNIEEANVLLNETDWKQFSLDDYRARRTEEELKKLAEEKQKAEEAATAVALEDLPADEAGTAAEEIVNTSSSAEAMEDKPEETPETLAEEKTPEELIAEKIEMEIESNQPFFRKDGDNLLSITLTTVDQPENVKAAEIIKANWKQLGVRVNLNIVSPAEIRRTTIKDRNYEALLYAEILGSDPDPFPFWHSSQNQHPGLNLAIFSNRHVDTLLEEARQENNEEERQTKYIDFQNILAEELPAIFLYSPTYTYVADKKVKNISAERLTVPADRFAEIENWYIKTKRKFK